VGTQMREEAPTHVGASKDCAQRITQREWVKAIIVRQTAPLPNIAEEIVRFRPRLLEVFSRLLSCPAHNRADRSTCGAGRGL
jgi:hypothetical protein